MKFEDAIKAVKAAQNIGQKAKRQFPFTTALVKTNTKRIASPVIEKSRALQARIETISKQRVGKNFREGFNKVAKPANTPTPTKTTNAQLNNTAKARLNSFKQAPVAKKQVSNTFTRAAQVQPSRSPRASR